MLAKPLPMRVQVENGMWVRNGRTVERLAFLYRSAGWACLALDLDIALIQLWAATSLQHFG